MKKQEKKNVCGNISEFICKKKAYIAFQIFQTFFLRHFCKDFSPYDDHSMYRLCPQIEKDLNLFDSS